MLSCKTYCAFLCLLIRSRILAASQADLGCIAGGRNYLHINAKGDVQPCVFIHYSNCNIHEVSPLDALKSPLFMAYHANQPFNENMLLPCPILENPEKLREMMATAGAMRTGFSL